ncbi:MAG: Minichromosome maintenance protein MCM, partial [Candidatus Bathyarchaeota archaeon]|nr:Minichromosome maintenance protein MCM [Candidatus Bathyarchaeota archaeon]
EMCIRDSAKGGIVATLNARTSILAAANPTHGRYEDRLSVADNINLPVVILSRFDLIFIQRDVPEKTVDEKLSEHILNVHRSGGVAVTPPIPPDLLRKYINYARAKIHPRLTDEAINHLRQFYLKMRELSSGEGAPIAITPRQLEALIRITESRARAALREEATKMDAEAAIRIMEKSLRSIGVLREEAGVADIDVLMTGKPATLRDKITTILMLVGEMEKESEKVNLEELYAKLTQKHGIDRMTAEDVIRRLIKEGTLYSPEPGYVKKARF